MPISDLKSPLADQAENGHGFWSPATAQTAEERLIQKDLLNKSPSQQSYSSLLKQAWVTSQQL